MYNCDCLIHPFQNDPGTSQNERVMDDLLDGAAKIDARTLADLLDFFMQMSRHINFYDTQLRVSDWQPFFQKSIPFTLASIIKNPTAETEQNFNYYNSLFDKKPSSTGLQLLTYFIYYRFINKINNWYLSVKDSGLPIESFLQILIKDKLQQPLKSFISYTNAAVKFYRTRKIDFSNLSDNSVWNLQSTDLYVIDNSFQTGTISKFQQIKNLYQKFQSVSPPFFDAIKIISAEAENNLESSLLPLKDELQKKHPPHLGLLFAFLNIFRQLQNDLNGCARKHLDFFYKDVLLFKSRDAIPDKAHIIFEIQKQLEKYLVKKGLLVKDGKDNNKQEILFSLDDDIVVNKTQVAEVKTLFLNNQSSFEQTCVEGVYIANDATKADGTDKDFKDNEPKNFPTLGAKVSKYSDPETKIIKAYPNARLGFILASPVLYLKEGTRKVDITLACMLHDSVCADMGNKIISSSKNCCDDVAVGGSGIATSQNPYPDFLANEIIFSEIKNSISKQYIYLDEDILKEAISKGLDEIFVQKLRDQYLRDKQLYKPCYCNIPVYKTQTSVPFDDWKTFIAPVVNDPNKRKIIDGIFKPENVLNILFSGEKDWLQPAACGITMSNLTGSNFVLTISATINADQPAVSFYSKQIFNEDFNSTQPLVKIELNDRLKFSWNIVPLPPGENKGKCCQQDESCCLLKNNNSLLQTISFYQFFRNIKVLENIGNNKTRIDVKICGLKNFIVQNDESLQDVNGPVYAFGTRPHLSSNFYIGCKEIFYKNWQECWININWKDRPDDLKKYYQGYQNNITHIAITDFANDNFIVEKSLLNEGLWQTDLIDKLLPPPIASGIAKKHNSLCADSENNYELHISLVRNEYPQFVEPSRNLFIEEIKNYNVNSRNGFIRLTLKNTAGVDFQHSNYSFILGRQMMAFGKLPKEAVDGAVYYDPVAGNPVVFSSDDIKNDIAASAAIADRVVTDVHDPVGNDGIKQHAKLTGNIPAGDAKRIRTILYPNSLQFPGGQNLIGDSDQLKSLLVNVNAAIGDISKFAAIIPNEPWTPIISNMSLDYTATATLEDIDLIHLYPFSATYKLEEIKLQPTLFATFCDEGTLFLGLQNLVPGDNLNILFQLAEATSDSESEKEEVEWHYLDNNVWKSLRPGFEVLDDATGNLTTSGIIKFALPANMTTDNTIMPKDLYWIKASVPQNSKAVSETTGIFTQAISGTFTNETANDKLRLSEPLVAGSISKLNVADSNIKSVQQPYGSFGGEVPEIEQQFYVRVSEQLRHKGRAIQKFDYERLTLEAFPQLFKVKCINHSFALNAHLYKNDFPYAPGYIILAVIPDLNKLKAGNSFEPKVPVSILEKIENYIHKHTSPFVRFRAMNPRYEKINFCLRVNLLPGKDENYYKEQLKEDLKELLAPWAIGKYDKLTFGQCVYRSDIIRFLEQTNYVDFITDFRMAKDTQQQIPDASYSKICPNTPRSILIAGDIEVCINNPDCDDWRLCYDQKQEQIDCCTNPLIPVENYCKEIRLM
jgi:hypothetical protein